MKFLMVVFVVLLCGRVEGGEIFRARYAARGRGDCLVCQRSTRNQEAVEIIFHGGAIEFVHGPCTGISDWNPWRGATRANGAPLDRWRTALTYN